MALNKKDFIEIEFTAKTKGGEIFDSNIFEELKKINPDAKEEHTKPFVFSLGEGMFIEGVDDFLIGKEPDKKYLIELKAEKAFGKRIPKLVQLIPSKIFREQKINPVPGFVFNFDGKIGKILSASGGRIMVDFNNPLAGKDVVYDVNVIKKIENINDKVKAMNEFLFKKDFKFQIDEKAKKIILEVESSLKKFVELFEEKFKDIISYGLDVKEVGEEVKEEMKKVENFLEKKE
jgi:FKBP-type peptidyl-prolyl cis-trans isomerase 2